MTSVWLTPRFEPRLGPGRSELNAATTTGPLVDCSGRLDGPLVPDERRYRKQQHSKDASYSDVRP
jgi:hypothetical protein